MPRFMKKRAQSVMAFTGGVSEMVKAIRQRCDCKPPPAAAEPTRSSKGVSGSDRFAALIRTERLC